MLVPSLPPWKLHSHLSGNSRTENSLMRKIYSQGLGRDRSGYGFSVCYYLAAFKNNMQ